MKIQLISSILISFASIAIAIKNKTYSSSSEAGGYGSGSTLLGLSSSDMMLSLPALSSIPKTPPIHKLKPTVTANTKNKTITDVENKSTQSPRRPYPVIIIRIPTQTAQLPAVKHQAKSTDKTISTPRQVTAIPRHRKPIPAAPPVHHRHKESPPPAPLVIPSQFDNQCVYMFETFTGQMILRRCAKVIPQPGCRVVSEPYVYYPQCCPKLVC